MTPSTATRRRPGPGPAPVRPPRFIDHADDVVVLRAITGEALPFDSGRWHGEADDEERLLLDAVGGPVIDLGCGPGRLLAHLLDRGVEALGVDTSTTAAAIARSRGAMVIESDIFGPLPDEGGWRALLLFDGNVGIGGDPGALLGRCHRLLRPDGSAVVEVGRPGSPTRSLRARIERHGEHSSWFPWALVSADDIGSIGAAAGLGLTSISSTESGRWFAELSRSA